jgi:hypothetical protein
MSVRQGRLGDGADAPLAAGAQLAGADRAHLLA